MPWREKLLRRTAIQDIRMGQSPRQEVRGRLSRKYFFFFFGILLYSLLLFYILLKPNAGEKGISNDKYTIKKIEFNHVPVSCAVIFVDRCGWQLLTDIPNTATHPVLCHHFRTWMHLPKDTVTSRFKHNADVENAF